MKFSVQWLEDNAIAYGECIHEEVIDSGRWTEVIKGVFEYEGKFYSVQWETGLTEEQENDWFANFATNGEVECPEVEQYEVTVKKWREKK